MRVSPDFCRVGKAALLRRVPTIHGTAYAVGTAPERAPLPTLRANYAYTTSTIEPVVLRASMSAWACGASRSG
jgi:hypothetical protein